MQCRDNRSTRRRRRNCRSTGARASSIENIAPAVDGGRFAIKRVVGERVVVEADCFADGHDSARVRRFCYRRDDEARLARDADDRARQRPLARRVHGRRGGPLSLHGHGLGRSPSCPGGTISRAASTPRTSASPRWRGAALIEAAARRAPGDDRGALAAVGGAAARRATPRPICARSRWTMSSRPIAARYPDRSLATTYPVEFPRRRRSRRARASPRGTRCFPRSCGAGPGHARHVARLRGAAAVRRADGLRRALPAADPSDRPRAAQGPQQRARGRRGRRRQPVGDRRGRGRPQGDPSAARHARGLPPSGRSARAQLGPRDRARHRVPVRARSSRT